MAAESLVLLPSPAIGHLISMVELGKLILSAHPSFSIHILIIPAPYNAGDTSSYIVSVASAVPSIFFHRLPAVTLPFTSAAHHETLTFEALRLSQTNVRQILVSISETSAVKALVMDFFCAVYLNVSSELKIPGYFYFTSPAACLALLLYNPTIHRNTTKSFKDLNGAVFEVPGLPPVPATDMVKPMQDRNDKAYDLFIETSDLLSKSDGILINTFELLENRTLKAIRDGLCVPDGRTPPIYSIGPLIADRSAATGGGAPEWFLWLDMQPRGSVVFLCFGSLGLFSKEQLGEIALGLERSGRRFLWVVRNPPAVEKGLAISGQLEPDLASLLPDGFLTRTKERGLVVKNWAPQVAVLSHDSVGGFVTHCGWNSVLESLCAGVPMVAWPLYAEQRLNRVVMVNEMRIALPMDESEDGFVSAAEVERRVVELMGSESGDLVREWVVSMRDEAVKALSEGGSSRVALTKLIESWRRK